MAQDEIYKMDAPSIKFDFTIDSNCILSKLMSFNETTKQKEGINEELLILRCSTRTVKDK